MKIFKRILTRTALSIMSLSLLMTIGFTSATYAEPLPEHTNVSR